MVRVWAEAALLLAARGGSGNRNRRVFLARVCAVVILLCLFCGVSGFRLIDIAVGWWIHLGRPSLLFYVRFWRVS